MEFESVDKINMYEYRTAYIAGIHMASISTVKEDGQETVDNIGSTHVLGTSLTEYTLYCYIAGIHMASISTVTEDGQETVDNIGSTHVLGTSLTEYTLYCLDNVPGIT